MTGTLPEQRQRFLGAGSVKRSRLGARFKAHDRRAKQIDALSDEFDAKGKTVATERKNMKDQKSLQNKSIASINN